MKFDSNLAWQQASASVSANRDVLFALAGVFVLLPSLAMSLLFPQPEPTAGMTAEQIGKMALAFYSEAAPWMIPMALLQGVGTLAILALLTDMRRPTVSQAIRLGALGLVRYIGAQLLVGLACGIAGGMILAVAIASGSSALATICVVLVAVGVIYVAIKTSLVSPVIMVEGVTSPIAAIVRSWRLTQGNSARIGLFYLLLLIAFMVVTLIVTGLLKAASSFVAGAEVAHVTEAVVSSAIGAIATLYAVAVAAAVHRQLASGEAGQPGRTFS